MGISNITVKQFANHFLLSNSKIKVTKVSDVIFEGSLEELYHSGDNVLSSIIMIVDANNGFVCLDCRK